MVIVSFSLEYVLFGLLLVIVKSCPNTDSSFMICIEFSYDDASTYVESYSDI